ncbi:MAG: DUF6090 family protein [Eudoraea sp.]|uniref:DUF6090 family protein n=1 Tax=Eudoraea sp. TaxID=1979955 RepID=UPI003265E29D
MINFFRKIRKKLADDNKPLKYARYAIGEIVLVVVGILIAVQLNNLNEYRKQKLVEIDILDGIRNDILKDTIDLNFNIRQYKILITNDSLLLNLLINKKVKSKNLVRNLNFSINNDYRILLHDSHFQEGIQKGLSIISNESLRDEINRLYQFEYAGLKMAENNLEVFDHGKLLRHEIGQYFGYDSTGIIMSKTAYEKLLSNNNSLYYIEKGRESKATLLKIHETTLEFALKIADRIKKEVASLKEK